MTNETKRQIDIDQGHSSCQRCLELRLKDSEFKPRTEYFQLCNTHFEIIIKEKQKGGDS